MAMADLSILNSINFSLLENIDFSNKETLLFFAIFLVAAIIVFFIFILILAWIIKLFKKTIIGLFNLDVKRPKLGQENTGWVHPEKNKEAQGADSAPKQKIVGGDTVKSSAGGEAKAEEVKKGEEKIKEIVRGGPEAPAKVKKFAGGILGGIFKSSKKKPAEEQKDALKSDKEKEEKGVAEGLSKLKAVNPESAGAVQARMSAMQGKTAEEGNFESIKIPTSAKSREKEAITSSSLHGQSLTYSKETRQAARKTLIEQGKRVSENIPGGKEGSKNSSVNVPKFETVAGGASNQHPGEDNSIRMPIARKSAASQQVNEGIIFEGKPEVPKKEIEHEMKTSPKIWQASRQAGLNLSPVERAKLVKEVFSPTLGLNISKSDLKISLKKLNQKMLNTANPQEHARLRKEVNFFKKIGGVK